MKMFKAIVAFACAIFFLSLHESSAQFYIQPSAGYGIGLGSTSMGGYSKMVSTDSLTQYEVDGNSFGQGIRLGIDAGYMLSPNLGISLGAEYQIPTEINLSESESRMRFDTSNSKATGKGGGFFLLPGLVLNAYGKGFSPFARFGAVLGFPTVVINQNSTSNNSFSSGDRIEENTVSGGTAFGLFGGAGVIFPAGEKISFVGEIKAITLSYAPTQLEVTKNTVNGKDVPMTDEEKKKELVKSGKSNDKKTDATSYLPFSSVSFNVGLRINL